MYFKFAISSFFNIVTFTSGKELVLNSLFTNDTLIQRMNNYDEADWWLIRTINI